MLIGTERNFIFVANTKAASTAIEAALRPHADIVLDGTPARKHMPLACLHRGDPGLHRPGFDPARAFAFGVMRDPADWIGSWFRYRRGNRVAAPLPRGMSFAAFWAAKDWNLVRPSDGRRMLQRDMFCAPDGTVLADVIIPYSRLGPMLAEICALLGIGARLQRLNVSAIAPGADIPPDLHAELRAFYAEDYALLDRLGAISAAGMARLRRQTALTAPAIPRRRP